MNNLLKKDKKNRKEIKKFEHKKLILKNFENNQNLSKLLRWKSFENLCGLQKKNSLFHINNRCILTGRKKRINKSYSFSRIMFLKLVRSNNINGLKKSSW